MKILQESIRFPTERREDLIDITDRVEKITEASGITVGTASVYACGATGAIMIQENWDRSVQSDVISLLQNLVPRGIWQHDLEDGNGDSHLKAGIVGPSEVIPVTDGRLGLSRWQNIFFCEFDGPRNERTVTVTLQGE